MRNTNQLVICKEDYETKHDFENAIRDAVMVLLNNNYIMTVDYDEKGLGIVVIEYNHSKEEYGSDYPRWLSPTEFESVVFDSEK
jgi:hypothetical protein